MDDLNTFVRGSVIDNLTSTRKYDAIHELLAKAAIFRSIEQLERVESAVMEREHCASTGLGRGIAVAHGKCREIDGVLVALGISRKGVDFDAIDGRPVHFLFLVANNPQAGADYLCTLSCLIKIMKDEAFRNRLIQCRTSMDIEQMLHWKITSLLASSATNVNGPRHPAYAR